MRERNRLPKISDSLRKPPSAPRPQAFGLLLALLVALTPLTAVGLLAAWYAVRPVVMQLAGALS